MDKLLMNFLLSFCCCCLLLLQPTDALRIKRNATGQDTAKDITAGMPLVMALTTAALVANVKPQVNITNATKVAAAAAATATAAAAATASVAATAAVAEPLPAEHQAKRRMSLNDESLLPKVGHRGHHHNVVAAPPPYVYFNKLISPDGKQELKEFQFLAPNVVIESLQHDLNYGPNTDLDSVLLLQADNNNPIVRAKTLSQSQSQSPFKQHHNKHKSALAGLPPFLFMLQQMLQPNLNQLDMETQLLRNRQDAPLYQFLDGAVDNALRNNHDLIETMLNKHELSKKDKNKDAIDELQSQKSELKEAFELMTNRKDDELIVSCPIHHEHHASINGDIMDDDVVLVNECHVV